MLFDPEDCRLRIGSQRWIFGKTSILCRTCSQMPNWQYPTWRPSRSPGTRFSRILPSESLNIFRTIWQTMTEVFIVQKMRIVCRNTTQSIKYVRTHSLSFLLKSYQNSILACTCVFTCYFKFQFFGSIVCYVINAQNRPVTITRNDMFVIVLFLDRTTTITRISWDYHRYFAFLWTRSRRCTCMFVPALNKHAQDKGRRVLLKKNFELTVFEVLVICTYLCRKKARFTFGLPPSWRRFSVRVSLSCSVTSILWR